MYKIPSLSEVLDYHNSEIKDGRWIALDWVCSEATDVLASLLGNEKGVQGLYLRLAKLPLNRDFDASNRHAIPSAKLY